MYSRTSCRDSNGIWTLHSRCFLFRPLPLPTNSRLIRTFAIFHTLDPPSVSTDSSSKTPSFSSASSPVPVPEYLTYMGSSLNLSRSCGICTTRSAPGEETCKESAHMNVLQARRHLAYSKQFCKVHTERDILYKVTVASQSHLTQKGHLSAKLFRLHSKLWADYEQENAFNYPEYESYTPVKMRGSVQWPYLQCQAFGDDSSFSTLL